MDIPVHLRHRPTSSGLVVPIATPRTTDGQYLFGLLEDRRQRLLLLDHRCQVCGNLLGERLVVFARPADLLLCCTSEPALCPPCAAYSRSACPMLAGRLDHYRTRPRTAEIGLGAGTDSPLRRGAPAETWHTVWLTGYEVVPHPARPDVLAASWLHHPPLTVRPIHSAPSFPRQES
ncbi:hypothetical protein [Actinoplanes awajinensis]|uniref:Uncharacterized protein n=1 Tax=Actinoplanes awajinensis subsp. mycoplanecinus TaxID=135947 RepID=A0A101JFD3_9ACTN|nr:hypothetical protein [Actinoplanes awajinensis]KUL25833.1 hypothetical protein ADL15_39695 [Actinoplanes awajinensis subsp. mycoplanecinus]